MPPFPELKDITPPTAPPFSSPEEIQALVWQAFGGVALALLGVACFLWWRWRVRRSQAPPLPVSALAAMRRRLGELQAAAPRLDHAALGQQVSETVRGYLQREHGLLARYRTTEELFGTVKGARRPGAPPPLPFLRPFEAVFTRCDELKFAGLTAGEKQRSGLIDTALAACDEVEKAFRERPATASPPALTGSMSAPPSPSAPRPAAADADAGDVVQVLAIPGPEAVSATAFVRAPDGAMAELADWGNPIPGIPTPRPFAPSSLPAGPPPPPANAPRRADYFIHPADPTRGNIIPA